MRFDVNVGQVGP